MYLFFDLKSQIGVLTVLVAAFVGHFLFRLLFWMAQIEINDANGNGKWLGFFERALIALFVFLNFIPQTVFIFAIKAAILSYRLPDKKHERRNISEYMLLGTMISYFIALCIGLVGLRVSRLMS